MFFETYNKAERAGKPYLKRMPRKTDMFIHPEYIEGVKKYTPLFIEAETKVIHALNLQWMGFVYGGHRHVIFKHFAAPLSSFTDNFYKEFDKSVDNLKDVLLKEGKWSTDLRNYIKR